MSEGNISRSITEFESEWKTTPSRTICARLADLLRQAGRYDEALDLAREGLRRWPTTVSIEIVLGRCHRSAGRLDSAMETFRSLLERQPLNLVALRNMAEMTFEREIWRESIDYLEEYLLEQPGDQEVLDMLEEARAGRDRNDPITDDDASSSEVESDAETEPAFPETDRMRRVLQDQEIPADNADAVHDDHDDGSPADDAIERGIPPEAASLLDLFTEEEKIGLGLHSFEGSSE